MLTTDEIIAHSCYGLQRGRLILAQRVMQDFDAARFTDGSCQVTARIEGSNHRYYRIVLRLNPQEEIIHYNCTCPAAEGYPGMCKHCTALALRYQQWQSQREAKAQQKSAQEPATSQGLAGILARYSAPAFNLDNGIARGQVHLEPELENTYSYTRSRIVTLSCRIGVKRMYVVKNLVNLVHCVLSGASFSYGKALTFVHSPEMFDTPSRRLLLYLEGILRPQYPSINTNGFEYSTQLRYCHLEGNQLAPLLNLYQGSSVILDGQPRPVVNADPSLQLTIRPKDSGARIDIPVVRELSTAPEGYLFVDGTIHRCSDGFIQTVFPFLNAVNAVSGEADSTQEFLGKADYRSFCGNVLPRLERYMSIEMQSIDLSEFRPKKPEFSFYLSLDGEQVLLRPSASYGGAEYPLFAPGSEYRNADLEAPIRGLVQQYFSPTTQPEEFRILDEDTLYTFLSEGLDAMRQTGEVYIDDSMKQMKLAPVPKASIGVSLKGNLIDLNVQVEQLPDDEMERLLHAYTKKKKYYRLQNGSFLSLTEGSLAVLSELSETLQLQGTGLHHAEIPAFRAQYINELLSASDSGIQLNRSLSFKHLVRNLRNYSDSDYDTPASLNAKLRNYQKIGYRWLCTLSDCALGGILADDMGLGKTIQIIALLLHLNGTALIVCPASLLYNWESELHRFAPNLSVQLIHGSAAKRIQQRSQAAQVYVTSYDLLRQDIEDYQHLTYRCCILDEAQYIRNASTKVSKAVKLLRSDLRFALTGTPIENRLSDLWSIFDFILPGYLYSYPEFRTQLEAPVLEQDTRSAALLQRMVRPFLLRRKKAEVLQELPPKVESIQYIELTGEQQKLYQAQEQQLRQSLLEDSPEQFSHNKLQYLSALTRLRQLCCAPQLYLERYHGGSAKIDACMEHLEESSAEGRKTLVFSQFTTMLELLLKAALRQGISALYLSGKDSAEQRRDMVNEFQNGDVSVFFISLKAGGTGLNLTAADAVIHFDPWWNFAAEDQATDRAHRIGQKKTVFVTKLVAKDTVEEKIIALQDAKRTLSDHIISGNGISAGSFSREELIALLSR